MCGRTHWLGHEGKRERRDGKRTLGGGNRRRCGRKGALTVGGKGGGVREHWDTYLFGRVRECVGKVEKGVQEGEGAVCGGLEGGKFGAVVGK